MALRLRRSADSSQLSLLDWQPPEPTVAFDPAEVRGVTFDQRLSRAVATALHDTHTDRDEVAQRMSSYLGQDVSVNMLNGYASPSREDHRISVPRLMALLHATGDRRLLELLAEPFGWAVIERRLLPLIEVAEIRRHEDKLRRRRQALEYGARKT
jgi:hypothetical protein